MKVLDARTQRPLLRRAVVSYNGTANGSPSRAGASRPQHIPSFGFGGWVGRTHPAHTIEVVAAGYHNASVRVYLRAGATLPRRSTCSR